MAVPVPYYLQRLGAGYQYVYATIVGGIANAYKIVSTDASGTIPASLFPAGIGMDIVIYPATEAIAAGQQVNLYSNAGVLSARNADAASANGGKKADGFVIASVASGANATVYRNGGVNTGVSGLTPGADYYLAAGGGVTTTQNATPGQTDQYIGKASAAGVLDQLPPQPFVAVN